MVKEQETSKASEVADSVSQKLDADVILYNGEIQWTHGDSLTDLCDKEHKHKNVLLVLITTGGDPHAAYRIARCLQQRYDKFAVYIPGLCKSAGTLVTLGAEELIIADQGELGPLDIQLRKRDELWEMSSGLTVMEALDSLRDKSYSTFEKCLLDLKLGSGGQITLKTAMEIASSLTTGLYGPLYQQIDPLTIGENGRAMKISQHYGEILGKRSKNLEEDALEKLIASYPAHDVVIDRDEAKQLFKRVREPSEEELQLAKALNKYVRYPLRGHHINIFLSNHSEALQREREETNAPPNDQGNQEEGGAEVVSTIGDTGEEQHRPAEPLSGAKIAQVGRSAG